MPELASEKPKRKVLGVRLQPQTTPGKPGFHPPCFVADPESIYMVWGEGSDMPKRIYRDGERSIAESHAKNLARETGKRFWVMRAWRGYDPA